MPHAEVKMNDEPTVSELLNSELTRLAMKSDNVQKGHVEALITQAAQGVRSNRVASR